MQAPATPTIPAEARRWRIGLLGYGEVGRILAEDLRAQGIAVSAYDRQLHHPRTQAQAQTLRVHAYAQGVELVDSAAALAAGCDCLISAVTASQTQAAIEAAAPGLRPGAWVLDLNSASPGTKQAAAAIAHAQGARYVEAAVMNSVPPQRIRTPMLLGGPGAAELAALLAPLGFACRAVSAQLGVASATKMCRSVLIKGLEALCIESLSAARHFGVEDAVLASLQDTFPGVAWQAQASYFFQRVIAHGQRRSEEMAESARTVAEAGLGTGMAQAASHAQGWLAQQAAAGVFGAPDAPGFARSDDWRTEADRLLAALEQPAHSTPNPTP